CASDVAFDHPYDTSFEVNVLGCGRLYGAVVDSGSRPHLVHVSTAYVAGLRRGPILEGPVSLEVHWEAEARALAQLCSNLEADSRRPELLSKLTRQARAELGDANPMAIARAIEEARREWVTSQKVQSGQARARALGFPDVYGLTKAF